MVVFYSASLHLRGIPTSKATYNILQEKHPTDGLNLNANKLSNIRHDIIKIRDYPS